MSHGTIHDPDPPTAQAKIQPKKSVGLDLGTLKCDECPPDGNVYHVFIDNLRNKFNKGAKVQFDHANFKSGIKMAVNVRK